jgi:hypothetical protein
VVDPPIVIEPGLRNPKQGIPLKLTAIWLQINIVKVLDHFLWASDNPSVL